MIYITNISNVSYTSYSMLQLHVASSPSLCMYRTKPSQVIQSAATEPKNHFSKTEHLMIQNVASLRKSAL